MWMNTKPPLSRAPIGFFDSGLGGLTLLADVKKLLPTERFIYIADTKYMPYGKLSCKEINVRSQKCMQYLQDLGCKIAVIACNTATACAAQNLRRQFSFPIIGIEPAVKPALETARGKPVIMLATPATVRSRNYIPPAHNLLPVSCRELAAFIEYNYDDTAALRAYISALLKSHIFLHAAAVVLGCTHYVYVKDLFVELLPPEIGVFDGNGGTAKQALKTIADSSIYNTDFSRKKDTILLTDREASLNKYADIYCALLNGTPADIGYIDI